MVGNFEIKSEGGLLAISIIMFVIASLVCYKTVQKEILLENSLGNEELILTQPPQEGTELV